MKEEKRRFSHYWKRIVKKKGFFPTLYLVIAALMLTGVLWYQNMDRLSDTQPNRDVNLQDEIRGGDFEQPSDPVTHPVENVNLPILEDSDSQIVTKFYDYQQSQEEQQQALVFYNNKYYQSQGIDIAATTSEPLQVVAALSGEVVEVKEDPILGYVVQIEHDHDVTTYYSSLTDVRVEEGQQVTQGELLAHAGTSIFGQEKGSHVHFELRKNSQAVDPEAFFDQPVTNVAVHEAEDVTDEADQDEESETETDLESGRTTTHT
ncbi:M23 family metallopeptidase [Amphibacillus sediminis]|uniref:M23 family metallopeptidase n=1 Tax=Amphibacillus sediminis TaxID=360185 RepID=UPI000834441E|nr:M23 family metallopeptidase [Amphibacillus sediminis]